MQFSNISASVLALLASTVHGAPAVSVDTPQAASAELGRRDDSFCKFVYQVGWQSFTVNIAGGIGDCQGFWDNIKGQCGLGITNWHCSKDSSNKMSAIFNMPLGCKGQQIGNAIYVSTTPKTTGIDCTEYDIGESVEDLLRKLKPSKPVSSWVQLQ